LVTYATDKTFRPNILLLKNMFTDVMKIEHWKTNMYQYIFVTLFKNNKYIYASITLPFVYSVFTFLLQTFEILILH